MEAERMVSEKGSEDGEKNSMGMTDFKTTE